MNTKNFKWIIAFSVVILIIFFINFHLATKSKNFANNNSSFSENYVPGEFIVKFKDSKVNRTQTLNKLTNTNDIREIGKIHKNIYKYHSDRLSFEQEEFKRKGNNLINSLLKNAKDFEEIEYIEPNYLRDGFLVPNDSLYNLQWSHVVTNTQTAWDLELGLSNPNTIAVIDSGVKYDHEDLVNNMLADCTNSGCPLNTGYDFVDISPSEQQDLINNGVTFFPEEDIETLDNDPYDFHGHGTHVAGVVAGEADNSVGVAGVCPGCEIMPLKALFAYQFNGRTYLSGYGDDVIAAIYYATDSGADIINLSLGGSNSSQAEEDAINYAVNNGVIVVASAGNSGHEGNPTFYPAAYSNVIAVGATAEDDSRAYYSNYGGYVDIAAPGGDNTVNTNGNNSDNMILSTVPVSGPSGNLTGYDYKQGTSFSAPYVAGAIGLIKSYNPYLSNGEVRDILINSADIISTDQDIGPRVNPYNSFNTIPTRNDFFEDVPYNRLFAQNIYALRDRGVIDGYGDNLFRPNNTVIRSHMAKFIKNGFNIADNTSCGDFPDVTPSNLFYIEITTLKCEGIIDGYGDGLYRPNNTVSRGAAMKFTINGARIADKGFLDTTFIPNTSGEIFPDVPSNHPFYDQIMSGYSNGIINGYGDGTFKPERTVGRGAMSKMIDNTYQFLTP